MIIPYSAYRDKTATTIFPIASCLFLQASFLGMHRNKIKAITKGLTPPITAFILLTTTYPKRLVKQRKASNNTPL